jgi:penicillin-binding protein 2
VTTSAAAERSVLGYASARRKTARFVTFGLVTVLALSSLTARLVYLQAVRAPAPLLSPQAAGMAQEAVPAPRGLIYDRSGRPLVSNVPSYTVVIRPGYLPASQRSEVVDRIAQLVGTQPADINAAIDGAAGSRFDPVRVARDVSRATADVLAESAAQVPGVEVIVEDRRQYLDGALLSQILGYTGPVTPDLLGSGRGYQPADLVGKAGVEATYEQDLRGRYGTQSVERDAAGRAVRSNAPTAVPQSGSSLTLTIDSREQRLAQQALRWGIEAAGLKRGVVIVMNPQTGEVLAMVSLPTYDDNAFARGISETAFGGLVADPGKPLTNHAIQSQFPPGSTYKLVTGTGGLADEKITARTRLSTRAYLTLGRTRFYDWNRRGFGACDIRCGFGHSSDTFFFQVAAMLGIDRLAYWADQFAFGKPTGIDLPGEVSGIVPSNAWKFDRFGLPIYPGEVYQAGIGQGYDAVTPIQLITAYAALANGGKVMQPQVVREVHASSGAVVRPFTPIVVRRLSAPQSVLAEMRRAARNVVLVRHTYNLVDLPVIVAGKSGTAEFGTRDAKGRLPFHSWFVGFVPKSPRPGADDPSGLKAISRTDSDLVVLAFAYDSRTKGNAATEIAKYFVQLHFGIRKDYRLPNLLHRGNFYEGN